MKDSILLFIFNSRRKLAILDVQIVSKAFSISRHTVAMYPPLRWASQMLNSKFVRTSVVE